MRVAIAAADDQRADVLESRRRAARPLLNVGAELPRARFDEELSSMMAFHSPFNTQPHARCSNVESAVSLIARRRREAGQA